MNKGVSVHGCLIVGGNANNGTYAGLAYVNSSNAFSNSNRNNGSRLYLTTTSLPAHGFGPGGRGLSPYHLVKHICAPMVLVGLSKVRRLFIGIEEAQL